MTFFKKYFNVVRLIPLLFNKNINLSINLNCKVKARFISSFPRLPTGGAADPCLWHSISCKCKRSRYLGNRRQERTIRFSFDSQASARSYHLPDSSYPHPFRICCLAHLASSLRAWARGLGWRGSVRRSCRPWLRMYEVRLRLTLRHSTLRYPSPYRVHLL